MSYVFDVLDVMSDFFFFFFFKLNTFQHFFFSLLKCFDNSVKEMAKKYFLYKIYYCEQSGKSQNPDIRSVPIKTQGCFSV